MNLNFGTTYFTYIFVLSGNIPFHVITNENKNKTKLKQNLLSTKSIGFACLIFFSKPLDVHGKKASSGLLRKQVM